MEKKVFKYSIDVRTNEGIIRTSGLVLANSYWEAMRVLEDSCHNNKEEILCVNELYGDGFNLIHELKSERIG